MLRQLRERDQCIAHVIDEQFHYHIRWQSRTGARDPSVERNHWTILKFLEDVLAIFQQLRRHVFVAKIMADFGLCWRQIDASWFLLLMVITTNQAQFWARYSIHSPLVIANNISSFRCLIFPIYFSTKRTANYLFENVQVEHFFKNIRQQVMWRKENIANLQVNIFISVNYVPILTFLVRNVRRLYMHLQERHHYTA